LFNVVETIQADPAFQTLADFPRVVLGALQRGDAVFVQNPLIAHDADLAGALDHAVEHPATGDAAETADVERLQDHPPPRCSLDFLGRQEPFQGLLDVVGDLVNDPVRADFDSFAVGQLLGPVFGDDVEGHDDGPRGAGQIHVAFVHPAHPLVQNVDAHFG